MKKNLRSKILLCVLAGGVLAANTAFAYEYTETIKDDITFNNGDVVNVDNIGIDSSYEELTVTVNGNVSINAENKTNDVTGIKIKDNSMLINGNDKAKLNITANGGEKAIGIHIMSMPNEIVINPDLKIKVSNNSNGVLSSDGAYGIYANYNTKFNGDINIEVNSDFNNEVSALNLGFDKFEFNGDVKAVINSTKNITKTSNDIAAGIHTSYGSETVFNKTVDLTFNANSYSTPIAGVISIISNPDDGNNILTFNDETKITVNNSAGMAVGVFCSGTAIFDHDMDAMDAIVNFRDDVYIDTNGLGINAVAILAQADSVVDISKAELSNTAENAVHGVIKGAIQSGTGINGDKGYVNLNFTGADSLIESDIKIANDDAVADLALHDGAVWRPTGLTGGSFLTNLSMNEGVVELNNSGTIGIRNYSGSGDINFKAKDTDNNGVLDFTNTGDVTIGAAEAGSSVNLGVINNTVNTLDIEKTEENLNAIAEKIVYVANDGKLGGKVTVKEGLITPEASADLMFDGNNQGYVTNITGGNRTTQTMDAMKNLAATAIVAWRQEDSTLSQRLGELRESDGGQGIWVRMSRGEFEYDGEYKNQYNFFQMGYDWAAGNWHYGAAVSHNDGQTTYTHGDGENRSTSLSLYGTWLGDKGHYADIVLKQGRLSNDFDIYTEAGHTSGDYDAWGTSLSGEYGMKVDLDGGWYVTPQAQLTLMRIGGEDYTTNNGIKVNQDSLESAVGRVGFEVGKRISDSGSIYAKASLLHDFAGSADTYLSLNGLTNSYHQDIGDTWCEAGIGFNYKTSENSYVYADVVKTFGGDVETPWQWNAGMRWTF